jgi:hypothetical protein
MSARLEKNSAFDVPQMLCRDYAGLHQSLRLMVVNDLNGLAQ